MSSSPPPAAVRPRRSSLVTVLLLAAVALIAGFLDAIAGGGGLLTLPALLLAGLPPQVALGTNKGQSVFGSSTTLAVFARSPLLDRRRAALSIPVALAGAAGGVLLVSRLSPRLLVPLVMVLLAVAATLMLLQRPPATPAPPRRRGPLLAAAVALVIGAYDGFFGPGTGTFLILAYAWLWRDPLDAASANAKAVNFASNLAAMSFFAAHGLVRWELALPMAAGQVVGSVLGARLTIRVGRPLVRAAVVVVSSALLLRLGWKLLRG